MFFKGNVDGGSTLTGCGCALLVVGLNLWAGYTSVQYLAGVFLSKVIPFWWALLLGLIGGELTIPVAIIVWILKHAGIL